MRWRRLKPAVSLWSPAALPLGRGRNRIANATPSATPTVRPNQNPLPDFRCCFISSLPCHVRIAPHPSLTIQHVCSLLSKHRLHKVERHGLSSLIASPPLVQLTLRRAYDHMR